MNFGAQLYYNNNCLSSYRIKCNPQISNVNDDGKKTKKRDVFNKYIQFIEDDIYSYSATTLSQIRDLVNEKDDRCIKHTRIRNFFEPYFPI